MALFTRTSNESPFTAAGQIYPGFLVAVTIGLAAYLLSSQYGAPVMLFALMLGMALSFLGEEPRCGPGIDFVCMYILRTGIVLLGVRITFAEIGSLGLMPIVVVVTAVVTTVLVGWLASKLMKQGTLFGFISGGAVGICGATAALAISSVLPRSEKNDQFTSITVVSVTAISTIAMVVYPMIAKAIQLDSIEAGFFMGGTIHDVAQVIGAGYSVSQESGDVATYTKLLRVAMLLPVVLTIAFLVGNGQKGASAPALPLFLVGFVGVVSINSTGFFNSEAAKFLSDTSQWMLVTAIAALGVRSSFKSLATVGWVPILILLIETVWIASVVFVGIQLYN